MVDPEREVLPRRHRRRALRELVHQGGKTLNDGIGFPPSSAFIHSGATIGVVYVIAAPVIPALIYYLDIVCFAHAEIGMAGAFFAGVPPSIWVPATRSRCSAR